MRMASQASARANRGPGEGGAPDRRGRKAPARRKPGADWGKLRELWQLPLLVCSVALFGVAGWLFIDPKPGLSIDQKIDGVRTLLTQVRPEAAIEQLNRILA